MKISITLPSLYPEAITRTLENLQSTTRNELEVIVVSPFKIDFNFHNGGRLIWIEDRKRDGCNSAHFEASKYITGDFIAGFADDHTFVDGWDEITIDNFMRRESETVKRPYLLGQRQIPGEAHFGHIGTVFGIYYPYFPIMRTEDMHRIGGWLSAEYKHGFGDPDLGLRVWAAGGLAEWSDIPVINVIKTEDDARHNRLGQFIQNDMQRFIAKWKPHFGKDWDTSHVRGFNVDHPLVEFGPNDRTCFRNGTKI